MASLEFASQHDFILSSRSKKIVTLTLQGKIERYEELGVVSTKRYMGHLVTISAMRMQGSGAGILYIKGSIAALKHYF